MEVPSNLDTFLKDMLAEEEATVALDILEEEDE